MARSAISREGCGRWAIIGFAWLVLWYVVLNGSYEAAIKGLAPNCGIDLTCYGAWTTAHSNFGLGIMIAIVTVPIPILVWGRFGWLLEKVFEWQGSLDMRRRAKQASEASQRKLDDLGEEAKRQKSRIDRREFVQSLGAASGYLDLLEGDGDRERQVHIRQGIAKELGDIVATYKLEELVELLREDSAGRIKLKEMLALMRRLKVRSPDAAVLREALGHASASGN